MARTVRLAAIAAMLLITSLASGAAESTKVFAAEGIERSNPEAGSQFDEPIDVVTIEFDGDITDDVELVLLNPDDDVVPSTTTRTGERTAQITFPLLEAEGKYTVRYLASMPQFGHVHTGDITFTFGSSHSSNTTLIMLGVVLPLVFTIGVWLLWRRRDRTTDR